jgi:hypothetical protein
MSSVSAESRRKKTLRKRLAAVMVAGVLAVPTLAAQVAQADTPGCVTKTEFRNIHKPMLRKNVHNIFDTSGKQTFFWSGSGDVYESREYNVCTSSYGFVSVDYKNKRVDGKFAYWG